MTIFMLPSCVPYKSFQFSVPHTVFLCIILSTSSLLLFSSFSSLLFKLLPLLLLHPFSSLLLKLFGSLFYFPPQPIFAPACLGSAQKYLSESKITQDRCRVVPWDTHRSPIIPHKMADNNESSAASLHSSALQPVLYLRMNSLFSYTDRQTDNTYYYLYQITVV